MKNKIDDKKRLMKVFKLIREELDILEFGPSEFSLSFIKALVDNEINLLKGRNNGIWFK